MLEIKNEFKNWIRQEIKHQLEQAMRELSDERRGLESAERRQPVTHHHIPVSENIPESGGGESGSGGGLRLHDGSRDVHSRSCESEHRILDGGTPRKEINAESSYPSPDMILQISLPIDVWAAIILEHRYEGFAVSARGQAASQGHDHIECVLANTLPNWEKASWPEPKSSR